jgi:hypothetical protein
VQLSRRSLLCERVEKRALLARATC